jgi:ubiquinol-cytochrome c reductase cytochrome b/c1 subunit
MVLCAAYMAIIYWDFVFHEESFESTNVVKTPDKIIPEWFFLTFFGFIKCIPSKLGGLGLLVLSILALFSAIFFVVTPLMFLNNRSPLVSTVSLVFYVLSVIGILSTNVVLCFPFIQYLQILVGFFLYFFLFKIL